MSITSNYRKQPRFLEVNNEPSMTEDAHILSLERLVKDYSRGIVHDECFRHAYYDSDPDTVPESVSDLSDLDPASFGTFAKSVVTESATKARSKNDTWVAPKSVEDGSSDPGTEPAE